MLVILNHAITFEQKVDYFLFCKHRKMNDLKYGYYDEDDAYYVDGQDVTDYNEADYEAYYDYENQEGGGEYDDNGEYVYYEEDPQYTESENENMESEDVKDRAEEKSEQTYEVKDEKDSDVQTEDTDVPVTAEPDYSDDNGKDERYQTEETQYVEERKDYDDPYVEEDNREDSYNEDREEYDQSSYNEDETEDYNESSYTDDRTDSEQSSYDDSESEYEDEDMDTLYRNYEILSEFYQKHFVDLRVLDETCEPSKYPAPSIPNGIVRKYERVDNVLLPGKQFRQAVYGCNSGYVLSDRTSDSMFCQEYAWTGLEPECEKSDNWVETVDNSSEEETDVCDPYSSCPEDQECRNENGRAVCYCSDGFIMNSSGDCEDVDECRDDNGGCDEDCINKPGSYMCACPGGYELGDNNHECVDTNECVSNNGHGPCQDYCVNMDGSYYCTCDSIEGSILASDGHTCQIQDMCAGDTSGCSHSCYSAQGRAYCTCPEGLQLGDDWKTCQDVDECRMGSPCEGRCVNTPGSYTCVTDDCDEDEEWRDGECHSLCGHGELYQDGQCILQCGEGQEEQYGECVPICEDGTVLQDGECVPVCHEATCGGHGECRPSGQTHQCLCDDGYSGDRCQCGPGFRIHGDECVDIDECYEEQPCSHLCNNTIGSYQCYCRDGFLQIPGSQDVCKDIDECNLKPAICEQGCVNAPGGFQCVCNAGFSVDPEDSTKCVSQGCPPLSAPEGGILNCSPGAIVPGSVCRLECHQGSVRFGKQRRKCLDNGTWEEGIGWCKKVTCPPISLTDNVKVIPDSCLTDEQSFKSKCRLSCPPGFQFQGSRAAFCGKTTKWIFRNGPTRCLPPSTPPAYEQIPGPTDAPQYPSVTTTPMPVPTVPSPYIVCPPDILLNLTGQPPMLVNIPKPKTNVDWEQNVNAIPPNAKSLSFYQEPGDMTIKFEATNSVSKQTAICKVRVHVKDVSRPTVSYCPQSRSVFLEPGQNSQKVYWSEPSFQDNVKIEHVIASALPGQELTLGKHVIVYQATDKEGNREKCVFSITVVQFQQEDSGRKWVLCRVGNTGRQIRLLVTSVPPGCRQINLAQPTI